MPTIGQKLKFKFGVYTDYTAALAKNEIDSNAVYYCTDTQQLFVGDTEYTRPVKSGQGTPSAQSASTTPAGSLYYDSTNGILYSNILNTWVAISNNYTLPASVLTTNDIVVCTQDQYDDMETRPALLYFIKEDVEGE